MGPALVKFERDQRQDTIHGRPMYLSILVELESLEILKEERRNSNLETKIKKEREN